MFLDDSTSEVHKEDTNTRIINDEDCDQNKSNKNENKEADHNNTQGMKSLVDKTAEKLRINGNSVDCLNKLSEDYLSS